VIKFFLQWEMEIMSKRPWAARPGNLGLFGVLGLLSVAGISARAQAPTASPAPSQEKQSAVTAPATNTSPAPKTPREKAWGILRDALQDDSAEKRAKAVRALGLLPRNAEAGKAAIGALTDEKANVRLAAAAALGSMHAEHATSELEKILDDSEPVVVLAAANSLLLLHDDAGYDVYYDLLTGERHATKGLIKGQLDGLKDKKKMAELGFEEGIGFIPYAGIGYEIFKTVTKDDSSPVRAAAAKKLAHDPNPDSGEALVTATTDKNWTVRAAALEAIAERGDRSLVPKITAAMDDDKELVRFMAAACIAHLSDLPLKKVPAKTRKP
jgi:HEAT repeat protein